MYKYDITVTVFLVNSFVIHICHLLELFDQHSLMLLGIEIGQTITLMFDQYLKRHLMFD